MNYTITDVKPLEDYKLLIKLENDEERIFDVSPYLEIGKFAELKDVSLFNSATVKFDSVEWANRLDIDPEFLYEKSIKV